MVKNRPNSKLNPARQAVELRYDFPDSTVELGPGRLTWVGRLTPSPLSQTYTVRIRHNGGLPSIRVLSPVLRRPEGKSLPHVYGSEDLCLYYPGQWDPSMSIAATLVPWAAEWLLQYELWLVTGTWGGGGHSSGPK
jgi:hypothetical protein